MSDNRTIPTVARPAGRAFTPEEHARIRVQLVLLPVYIWLVYGWRVLLSRVHQVEPVRDFVHFYILGTLARTRNAGPLYDMDQAAAMVPHLVPGAQAAYFPPAYGPQISVFFSPLARLSFFPALYAWLGLSLVAYVVCTFALWRVCPRLRQRPWTTALMILAAPALHFTLGFTQASSAGLVCLTGMFFALRADQPVLAGLALGSLAYKPPIGLGLALVFICAREWRIVASAAAAASAQIAIGCLYWGPSILRPYIAALLRYSASASDFESSRFQMHSWRSFFVLLGLPSAFALAAYVLAAGLTVFVALDSWRGRGPLALRYATLVIATILIDPHLYAYDLLLLTPALMLAWDWALAENDYPVADVFPRLGCVTPDAYAFRKLFLGLLYFCYFSPLLTGITTAIGVQVSVPAMALLGFFIFRILRPRLPTTIHVCTGTSAPDPSAISGPVPLRISAR